MKDNSLDGHRGKVALSDSTARNAAPANPASVVIKCDLKASNDGSAATNFDDDYNEWELGIGDLIIDLDADIEKTNEQRNGASAHQNGTSPPQPASDSAAAFNFLGAMSNAKSPRLAAAPAGPAPAGGNAGPGGTFEHQATVDKGLKMKIKRKTVGSKYSEAKHEIVQSDTKASGAGEAPGAPAAASNCANSAASSPANGPEAPNKASKHSSGKGRTGSHREKKEKNRDKDKNSSARGSTIAPAGSTPVTTSSSEMNGVLGVMSPLKITSSGVSLTSPAPPPLCSNSSPLPSLSSGISSTVNNCSTPVPFSLAGVVNSPTNALDGSVLSVSGAGGATASLLNLSLPVVASSTSPPMPNLTLKIEPKFASSPGSQQPCTGAPAVIKPEEEPLSPPLKKIKLENPEVNGELDGPSSPVPEMKDASTCASVGTITEPDCLGPCEPGTSVMLEGIVWQETDGGVLVVNVTWRDKSYVGTLLDCTKHDWAPPRFCESPTSDVDSKNTKGRGKRGRGGSSSAGELAFDARACVQSKLRNGKGRRTTVNSASAATGFTVPSSPAKSDGNGKRKGRPQDLELASPSDGSSSKSSKRNRKQERGGTPTSAPSGAEFSQPSSPVLIVCPEPNCGKKYKHINGLRYHQSHAHSAGSDSSGGKMDDTDSKDVTNSSDNEESMQESASVSTSPAPTFANTVPAAAPPPSSSSPSLNGLPPSESDPFSISTDLSTLASVAINDSKGPLKVNSPRTLPVLAQDLPVIGPDGDGGAPGLNISNPSPSNSAPSPLLPIAAAAASPSPGGAGGLPAAVSAVTTSVIQSSNSVDSSPSISQAVTVSIPTSHVIFNQGIPGPSCTTVCSIAANSAPLSPSRNAAPATVTTTFAQVSSIVNASATSPSPLLPLIDKNKIKPERPDKYKPKSPLSASAIRPIVPAPGPLIGISAAIPPHPGMDLASALKPIQPKPSVLGEPPTVNPALDSLKKEKSKHKKKSKDKERDAKKISSLPLTPTKLGMNLNEEYEAVELTSYPSLEAVSGSTGPLPGAPHAALSPIVPQPKPESTMDMSLADDSINENMPSPAYSDISDANDTAPVLESEVAAVKEKEDKVDKAIPDAAQSPAASINAYGMYTPYYSQPPYLIPSVSPQSSVSGSQAPSSSVSEKSESAKKDIERIKENRPWSNPSGESRDSRQQHPPDHHEIEKKPVVREESAPPNPVSIPSPAGGHGPPVQDYSLPPQHYPYSYGYVQGYPYSLEPSSYHMHMLENDPHYKQQYKQYLEEQQRLYKEQQHHHHQQQIQHQQQQQQLHGHHSQHQSLHHQSKSQHHPVIKEERDRDRSRESKERPGSMDKMQSSGLVMEYSSKIQHSSSMSSAGSKDHEMREIDARPPSLPAQARIDPSSASSAALKEKRDENHQILKENIELKSQMEDSKNKINQYEMAMIYERHREDMRRYYMYQDKVIEQQQQRMEPGIHHHTHLHQTVQTHGHIQTSSSAYASSSSSLKPHKDDLPVPSHSKSNHYGDGSRSSVVSPAKSDHLKPAHPNSTSSPKGGSLRESSLDRSKEYLSSVSSRESSKKESSKDRSEGSSRDEKKPEKPKAEPKPEPEGQKPTMETTGPPPPPTNSYAYLHPSYLQGPPHFPHMPFEPAAHAMYRGGINPMIVSAPHYGGSPYVHPQIRYVAPELSAHPQPPPEALAGKLHPAGPPKALDLLHHVSQQYTTTHKIHELQEHALMSPTPTSTPSSTPSSAGAGRDSASGKSSAESSAAVSSKVDASRDTSRSPPTQRHIHQHHHTHVGVGYPIYDPYGAIIPSPAPAVDCKPLHPLQVKPPAAGPRFWP